MSDNEHGREEGGLDAGLLAGFGPMVGVAEEQIGLGVLAELESRIGSETRVVLREEEPSDAIGPDAAAPTDTAARYQAIGEIARGGMGVIIRSRDIDLGREVAMKVLQPRHSHNRAMVRRFVEEAQIAGQLQHPGILQVYELGLRPDKRPYFTMKLIKGRTLAELLGDRGSLEHDRRRFLGIFERICQTMAYTHTRGVLHRDLKPANVMVGNFGEVQIVDWGLAKLIPRPGVETDPSDGDSACETIIRIPDDGHPGSDSMVGSILGTPAYMPPEQARGEVNKLDERSDVFALGAILCEILTGLPPFSGDAAEALEDAKDGHLDDAWSRLDACNADRELIELARACLAPRRRDRPADGKAVADRISAYLASVEERARASELAAVEAKARAAEERRARRLTIALAGSILLAVLAGGTGIVVNQNNRLTRIAAASEEANARLNEAMQLLAAAKETPVSEQYPWMALRAAGAQVAALQGAVELDQETSDRASAFLDEFSQADRDRRMIERIEDLVIAGATHEDEDSWNTMEQQMRQAFLDYGIDLVELPREEIAARIRDSDLAPQLADGLELWIATLGQLGRLGDDIEAMQPWAEVLYAADPDPYRTAVRRQVYQRQPDLAALHPLAHSADFETALPRTLAWLGSCFMRVGDTEGMDDVFRRALLVHPTDFMLNFDYAYQLDAAGRWEEAIRMYHRTLAIRPKNGGIWRRLGMALQRTGDAEGSIDALSQSIRYQPDYAPTHVDLGLIRAELGDVDGAIAAYRAALDMAPDLPLGHCALGLALQSKGMLFEALAELERGHELGSASPMWQHPSGQWVVECRRLLATREGFPAGRRW